MPRETLSQVDRFNQTGLGRLRSLTYAQAA